jgi:hypothetical protein
MQVVGALILAAVCGAEPGSDFAVARCPGAGTVDTPALAVGAGAVIQDSEQVGEPVGLDGGTVGSPPDRRCRNGWPEIWGVVGGRGFFDGKRMAPNGRPYEPMFALDLDFNLGVLPNQRLYLFGQSSFWAERANAAVTNPSQGSFDFSKREFDFTVGAAWNVIGPLELRAFGYALNNLNRGVSVTMPAGYADGVGVEGRCYLPCDDRYDVGKRSFLSVGYLPSKILIDANGVEYFPGAFARAYLTYEVPVLRSYLFCDGQGITDNDMSMRMLFLDAGVAARPFLRLPALEFRAGVTETFDVRAEYHNRVLSYGAIRVLF